MKKIEDIHKEMLKKANEIVNEVQKETKIFATKEKIDRCKMLVYNLLFNQFQGELTLMKSQKFIKDQQAPLNEIMKKMGF